MSEDQNRKMISVRVAVETAKSLEELQKILNGGKNPEDNKRFKISKGEIIDSLVDDAYYKKTKKRKLSKVQW